MITGNLKKLPNANTFNANDWSSTNGGITTNRGGSDAYITINSDFDESNFVQKSGSIITGNLVMEGDSKIIFRDGSTQEYAFSEDNINI